MKRWGRTLHFLALQRFESTAGTLQGSPRSRRRLTRAVACTRARPKSASLPLRWFVAPSSRLAKRTYVETGHRHFGITCSDSEFRRDDQLLPAALLRCGAGRLGGKCVFHDPASLALMACRSAHWPGVSAEG